MPLFRLGSVGGEEGRHLASGVGRDAKDFPQRQREEDERVLSHGSSSGVVMALPAPNATILPLAHRQRASKQARVSSGVDSSTGYSRSTRLGSSCAPAPRRAGSAMSPLSATSLTT